MSAVITPVAQVPPAPSALRRDGEPAALRSWPQQSWHPVVRTPAAPALDVTGVAEGDALLGRLSGLAPGAPGRAALRAQVIDSYLPMAAYLARRFHGRGEPLADLTQIAAIGLIKAVDRYDAHRGLPFAGYAIPTILGEIKRHFRDSTRTIRVPRRLQELKPQLTAVTEDLTHALRRGPTTAELAGGLGVSQRHVLDAQLSANAYQPVSLDRSVRDGKDRSLLDSIGGADPAFAALDTSEMLRVWLAELPDRERLVINLRYFNDMTQTQIAAEVGVSQMQISRLLVRSLAQLRSRMLADPDSR